jgi:integrase/recombinase XerC/integrase/recombinase XerD
MNSIEVIESWLGWIQFNKGRSESTVIKYRGYLYSLIEFINEKSLADVSLEDLEFFSGKHLFGKGLSSRSRSAAISAIRNLFAWMFERGIINNNPASKLSHPSIGRRLPRAISLRDAEKLLMAPDLDTFVGVRDAAMLSLLIGCGLRVSGLCSLNQSNLIFTTDHNNAERLIIRVTEKGSKERLIPAPVECLFLIRAYLGHANLDFVDRTLPNGDQVLFISIRNRRVPEYDFIGEKRRFATRSVNDMLAKYAEQTGVSVEFAHPHALRHLYGAELMESDVNILSAKALMGHERADTTEIYSHLAMRKLTKDVDRANPLKKITTPVTELISHLHH